MRHYKLSIIIPIYNSEKTMDMTIDSIMCQYDSRVEIILVDDGSTDRSSYKCDYYAVHYPNIKTVHKTNGGISSARNAGLECSVGEFVTFIDSDDYYSNGLFSELFTVLDEYNPDLIYFGWQYVVNGEVQPGQNKEFAKNQLLNRDFVHKTIIPPMINLKSDPNNFIDDYSCNKVFKKSIINLNSIRFDETRRIWEDRPFVVNYLKYCNSFYALDGFYYNYVQVIGSLSSRYDKKFFEIILKNYALYKELFEDEYCFDTTYSNNYWRKSIENMIIKTLKEKNNRKELEVLIKNTLSEHIVHEWYNNSENRDRIELKLTELINMQEYEKMVSIYRNRLLRECVASNYKTMRFKLYRMIKRVV